MMFIAGVIVAAVVLTKVAWVLYAIARDGE